ncbi:MAG: aminotransferase class III-fold pyridoxal phosphate-dependent enzyme, partial [Sphingobacteriales bacterium]
STWGGNLVDMVRATQILNIVKEDGLVEHAATTGAYLLAQLHKLAEKHSIVTNVRGRGLLCAFDLPSKAQRDKFIAEGLVENVMFLGCGAQTIRFRPALTIQKEHIDKGVEKMDGILGKL